MKNSNDAGISSDQNMIHLICMKGNIEDIVKCSDSRGSRRTIVKRAIDILIGLSLKGYEGRVIGAIYLVGDIERVKKNSTQMIINPFKGWKNVNIKDNKQLPTIESFTQLDGAIVFDNRGLAHYAGRMIKVKEDECERENKDFNKRSGKGSGTRWRAARFITARTGTIALTLSSSGNITVFRDGKAIGRLERRLCSMNVKDVPIYLHPQNDDRSIITHDP